MSIIKIYANDILLNFKKDTLTLKKENNSLSPDFKVTHSSFPFLIIDDEACKIALGSSDITSISKNKIIPVTVLELGVKYYGELQQISVFKGYRKCNLKYSSELLQIINKKIADFMPVVSVIPGETNPIPYTEESLSVVNGYENWETFPVSMIGKIYPEVKFQFPTMYWKNKYGVGLDANDEWVNYENFINNFITTNESVYFNINTHISTTISASANNVSVVSPQVFLLSPLFYILESLGWNSSGNFLEHELIKKTMLVSLKDNLCKIGIYAEKTDVIFPFLIWSADLFNLISNTFSSKEIHTDVFQGPYILHYDFTIPIVANFANRATTGLKIEIRSNYFPYFTRKIWVFRTSLTSEIRNLKGEMEFSCLGDSTITFKYYNNSQLEPIEYELYYRRAGDEKIFNEFHPTINLGRFVPDWTVGSYLNNLKNQFNLDVTLTDAKKEIALNFNETLNDSLVPEITNRSLAINSYELAANSSFVLKYGNDEDIALYISKEETVIYYDGIADDYTNHIESKFKLIPRNGYTSELSEEVEGKDGVGLLIYEPINAPFTSEATFNGFNLNIPGEKGIYETFFRRWLKFRLNASGVEMSGNFTEIEIAKIYKAKSIYIDNQRYIIDTIEYSEVSNNYFNLKMSLESVNY
jgi:hypothetical protein